MCLEDVKIGRLTTGNLAAVTAGTTPTLLVGASRSRRVLILFPHATVNYTVRFTASANDSAAFTVFTGTGPIELNRDKHGDIVSRSIFINTAAGGESIVCYAADFHPDDLRA